MLWASDQQSAIPAYAFAFILVLVFSVSNVGFGLITATIAKSSGAATGLSFLFVLPQLFLGTFVGASLSGGAQIAGKFVPSYYVTDALTSLFLRGAALRSVTVLLDLAVVSAFMRCHLSSRHSAVREILQNLNHHSFFFWSFSQVVNTDRIKRKLASLLVDCSSTKRKDWNRLMRFSTAKANLGKRTQNGTREKNGKDCL